MTKAHEYDRQTTEAAKDKDLLRRLGIRVVFFLGCHGGSAESANQRSTMNLSTSPHVIASLFSSNYLHCALNQKRPIIY